MSVFIYFVLAGTVAQVAMSRGDSDNVEVLQVVEDSNKHVDALQASGEKVSKPLALEAAAGKLAKKAFQWRKGKTENPCSCMSSWDYSLDNTTYEACAKTPDWEEATWCYVVGGPECSDAQDSHHEGEDRKWIECDPCACMSTWEYKVDNATYGGCAETPDWEASTWCYVEGGAECSTAKASEVDGETRKWLECEVTDPCDCMKSWVYKVDNATYEGCVETPDWEHSTWCYVEGGSKCSKAKESEVEGEDRKWMECDAEGASATATATAKSAAKRWAAEAFSMVVTMAALMHRFV